MNYTAYSGNWIVCGSYALVHAANLSYTDLIPIENSTGASFGISCAGDDWYGTRMLSVFRDFHYGIDAAAPLWGIQLKRINGETKEPIAALLEDSYVDRVIIGPVSMVGLVYLPLSQQYRCADHFIACIRREKNIWQLIDSEGVPGLLVDSEQIIKMLSIQDIPEACGQYTARAVMHVNKHEMAENRIIRIRYTLETAYVNLKEAQENGQGYKAIQRCAELVRDIPRGRYRPLLYDVDYLIQRKIMLLKLLQEAEMNEVAIVSPYITAEVNRFIEAAGALRRSLNSECASFQEQLFDRLAESENHITEKWKEWIKLWQ
ncbi:MAG: hypothetical protein HDR28_12335 [Lachnospiraceae bacterium]|nr:hypothetical protein [Lachnospiraceae bacterium]